MADDLNIFFSSNWRSLSNDRLIELDDINANLIANLTSPVDLLSHMSGWHFEQASKFQSVHSVLSQLGVEKLEHLRSQLPLLRARRDYVEQICCPSFDSDFRTLINTAILSSDAHIHSDLIKTVIPKPDIPTKLAKPKSSWELSIEAVVETGLSTQIIDWIDSLKHSDQVVATHRLIEQQTLENVGLLLDVTRERIRQIAAKLIRRVQDRAFCKVLLQKVGDQVSEEPILLADWLNSSQWTTDAIKYEALVTEIIKGSRLKLSTYKTLNSHIIGSFNAKIYEAQKRTLKGAIRQRSLEIFSQESVKQFLGTTPELPIEVIQRDIAFESDIIFEPDGTIRRGERASLHMKLLDLIEHDSRKTWSLHDLKQAALARHPEEIDIKDSSLGNALAEKCHLIGRGLYAKSQQLEVPPESETVILQTIEKLWSQKLPLRQWHASEIAEYMDARGLYSHIPYEEYTIYYVISKYPSLYRILGRLVFVSTNHSSHDTNRIEVHDLAVEILKNAGRPIPRSVVFAEILKLRGLGRNKQIHYKDPITTNGFGDLLLTSYV